MPSSSPESATSTLAAGYGLAVHPAPQAPPSVAPAVDVPTRPRLGALDGVRGIAIILVVLSHGWQLWPTDWIDSHAALTPLFRSGNFAVTIFLVAAGFLTYTGLAHRGLMSMRPGVSLVRRILRVGPSLWLMLAFLLVVATFDSTDTTPSSVNLESAGHVITYTWNWYVQQNLMASRPDFGHLWYLSVEMQAFIVMAVFLYFLRKRPVGVLFALGGFLLLLTWWRWHVSDTEYVFQVLVRTTARMDPFVVGVMLGAALPLVRPHISSTRVLRTTAAAALVALVPLAWYCSVDARFLEWGVTLLELDLAALFGASALLADSRSLRVVTVAPLVFLGRNSLLLYIWHYPIFVLVQRHTRDWDWGWRTLLAAVILVVVFVFYDRVVERRVSRWLAHPGWRKTDDGLGSWALQSVRRLVTPGR